VKKRLLLVSVSILCVTLLVCGFAVYSTIASVPKLFGSNGELKAQGYYMGEFEFKMVSSQYYLNEGRYLDAYQSLRRIRSEMQSRQGLRQFPDKATPEQQMAFLLDQQDPVTGAFMDRRYPAFSYFAPTCNVVEALIQLSRETGHPLALKYPLRFLNEIKTPQQLRTYLDSLLYVGEISAHFPGPGPYGPGVSEIPGYDVLEEAGVHRFSEQWKSELRRWFYETQDPATGFWGARIGNAKKWRQKTDINASFHILKLVLNESGENQSAQFPLRYAGTLARGVLESMDAPIPEGAADQHDWGLKQYQGAKMLTLFLWPHLSDREKDEVRQKYRSMLVRSYSLYRPDDGGFAYYTSSTKADVDGTGLATGVLKILGVLSGTLERERIWGGVSEVTLTPVRKDVQRWEQAELPPIKDAQSFRVYQDRPRSTEAYDDKDLVQIIYPKGASGLDVMDLRQGLTRFLNSDGATFGNWKSKISLKETPLGLEREIKAVPVSRGPFDLAKVAREHPRAEHFYVFAYDIAQRPIQAIEFVKSNESQSD